MLRKLYLLAAALTVALAATAVQATNQPNGDCNGSNAGNCNQYGGNGTGTGTGIGTGTSEADARAAANALAQGGNAGVDFWAGLSNQQRQALMSNQAFTGTMRLESNPQLSAALSNYSPSNATAYGGTGGQGGTGGTAEARQALMSSLSNYSPSSSRSAATGGSGTGGSGVGTVTVGDNVYYPSIPVAGAFVSAASTINPGGSITVVKSGCVGQVDVTDKRTLQATRGTLMGFFAWGYDNGFEQQVRAKVGKDAKLGKLQYGDWTIIGVDDKGRPIQEQTVEGFEYVIFAYLTSGGASNGVVRNGTESAFGVNGNQANTTFGTNVMEFSCSSTKTRTLIPVPKEAPPTPVGEKVWTLSYQVEQFRVVPIKGGVRPALPARTVKDSKRREALPPITVTCEGKGDKPTACPGKPAPGTAIDLTDKK